MTKHMLSSLTVLGLGAALLGCSSAASNGGAASSAPAAASASASTTQGWKNLIDPSMSAWRGYREAKMPAGWAVTDGVLSKTVSTNDLVTRDEFADFELEFDWKLHPGGNAGVFYRGSEEAEKIYGVGASLGAAALIAASSIWRNETTFSLARIWPRRTCSAVRPSGSNAVPGP